MSVEEPKKRENSHEHKVKDEEDFPAIAKDEKKSVENEHRKKERTEYHCLDDVCILVRVPSSSTYVEVASDPAILRESNESLQAYARQAEELQKQKEASHHDFFSPSDYKASSATVMESKKFDEYYSSSSDSVQNEPTPIKVETCVEYLDPVAFAKEFVADVIFASEASAEARIIMSPPEENDDVSQGFNDSNLFSTIYTESREFGFIETKRSFSGWPTIENFTIESGAFKIDEYLASFETDEDWMYVIYYQGNEETPCSYCYKYQVTYKYETFGHTRKPGVTDFQEKWLHLILDSKIKLFKTVTY